MPSSTFGGDGPYADRVDICLAVVTFLSALNAWEGLVEGSTTIPLAFGNKLSPHLDY